MWCLYRLARKDVLGREHIEPLLKANRPFIVAAWHNRNLMAPMALVDATKAFGRKACVIASQSKDGELAARALATVGLDAARGSSSRGGSRAMLAMLHLLKSGVCLGITPDGPRGPRYHIEPGVLGLARLGAVPILPLACDARPKKRLGSWDRLIVPLPFCRMRIVWGEPIHLEGKGEQELDQALIRLQEAMRASHLQAAAF